MHHTRNVQVLGKCGGRWGGLLGVLEAADGESRYWIAVVMVDVWFVVFQAAEPRPVANERRNPPEAVAPGKGKAAFPDQAVAARKGRKPKVVRAVVNNAPTISGL